MLKKYNFKLNVEGNHQKARMRLYCAHFAGGLVCFGDTSFVHPNLIDFKLAGFYFQSEANEHNCLLSLDEQLSQSEFVLTFQVWQLTKSSVDSRYKYGGDLEAAATKVRDACARAGTIKFTELK